MARTKFSPWQLEGRGNEQMKYAEISYMTPSHIKDDVVIYKIPFPNDLVGLNIKTIKIKSAESVPFIVRLMDGTSTKEFIYESIEELGFMYDSIDIPYKPADKALFVQIYNKGTVATKFDIIVRGIEVV